MSRRRRTRGTHPLVQPDTPDTSRRQLPAQSRIRCAPITRRGRHGREPGRRTASSRTHREAEGRAQAASRSRAGPRRCFRRRSGSEGSGMIVHPSRGESVPVGHDLDGVSELGVDPPNRVDVYRRRAQVMPSQQRAANQDHRVALAIVTQFFCDLAEQRLASHRRRAADQTPTVARSRHKLDSSMTTPRSSSCRGARARRCARIRGVPGNSHSGDNLGAVQVQARPRQPGIICELLGMPANRARISREGVCG